MPMKDIIYSHCPRIIFKPLAVKYGIINLCTLLCEIQHKRESANLKFDVISYYNSIAIERHFHIMLHALIMML